MYACFYRFLGKNKSVREPLLGNEEEEFFLSKEHDARKSLMV